MIRGGWSRHEQRSGEPWRGWGHQTRREALSRSPEPRRQGPRLEGPGGQSDLRPKDELWSDAHTKECVFHWPSGLHCVRCTGYHSGNFHLLRTAGWGRSKNSLGPWETDQGRGRGPMAWGRRPKRVWQIPFQCRRVSGSTAQSQRVGRGRVL